MLGSQEEQTKHGEKSNTGSSGSACRVAAAPGARSEHRGEDVSVKPEEDQVQICVEARKALK